MTYKIGLQATRDALRSAMVQFMETLAAYEKQTMKGNPPTIEHITYAMFHAEQILYHAGQVFYHINHSEGKV